MRVIQWHRFNDHVSDVIKDKSEYAYNCYHL